MDGNKANRIVSLCKKGDINEVIAEQLIIYKERGVYTEGYINLLSSFYL
jgi:tRNA1(Val) A37 N6-methylase TrmN6